MKVVAVRDISEQIRGVTYVRSDASAVPRSDYSPILRANNIGEHGLLLEDLIFVPNARISPKQRIVPNDLVVAASSGSISVVGKTAQAREGFDGGFGAFCKVLRPGPDVDPHYFGHYFKTPYYRHVVSKLASGANINNLKKEHLDNLQILLPPLVEQKRVAGILDAADTLRSKRRETLAQLDSLVRSTFLNMFGDPVTNPKAWERKPLGEVIRVRSGDGLAAKDMVADGKYPVYGGNGISGYHDSFMFEEPKIVLGRVGVYCGAVHLTRPRAWVTDNALYVHVFNQPVDTIYLLAALKMANLNQYAGRSAQPLISGSRIYPVEILVPPLDVQHGFATIVESIEQQMALQRAHLAELDTLFASLQSRAFRGDL